jgi:hypothetical protein
MRLHCLSILQSLIASNKAIHGLPRFARNDKLIGVKLIGVRSQLFLSDRKLIGVRSQLFLSDRKGPTYGVWAVNVQRGIGFRRSVPLGPTSSLNQRFLKMSLRERMDVGP